MTFKDQTIQHAAGEMAELTIQDFSEEGDTAEITTENGQPVCVASLNRSFGQPAYTGRLRVIRAGDSLYLVNILPVEEYLKGRCSQRNAGFLCIRSFKIPNGLCQKLCLYRYSKSQIFICRFKRQHRLSGLYESEH